MNKASLSPEHEEALERLFAQAVGYFNALEPHDLTALPRIFCANARFKDPFNEVQGLAAIGRIFAHMFESLHQPRFVVDAQARSGINGFVTWRFHFALREGGRAFCIRGATHWVFAQEQGQWRIALHRDYWDAAEELYAKLPVLGWLMRRLQARLQSP